MRMSKKRWLRDMVGRKSWSGLIFLRSGICVWLLVYVVALVVAFRVAIERRGGFLVGEEGGLE